MSCLHGVQAILGVHLSACKVLETSTMLRFHAEAGSSDTDRGRERGCGVPRLIKMPREKGGDQAVRLVSAMDLGLCRPACRDRSSVPICASTI